MGRPDIIGNSVELREKHGKFWSYDTSFEIDRSDIQFGNLIHSNHQYSNFENSSIS